MKIKHSEEMKEAIKALLSMMDSNERTAELFNIYLSKKSPSTYDFAKKMFERGTHYKDAFLESFQRVTNHKKGSPTILDRESISAIRPLNQKIFANDPYYKTIHFANETKNNWELRQSWYEPFQGFVYDEITIKSDNNYKEITPFGYFLERFPYLEILEDGKNWMSLTPHEILTMKEPIKEAKGKVLTFGLGMGYYAFMASNKKEVEKVTVIEREPTAISLFRKFILPQFPNKRKIEIIEEDAFEFAKRISDDCFDTVFVDIWHLPFDGLFLYLRFKKIFSHFVHSSISYWIERSILTLLRRATIILIDEEYRGYQDNDYEDSDNETDALINSLHFALKEKEINTISDLYRFLSETNLKNIASCCFE